MPDKSTPHFKHLPHPTIVDLYPDLTPEQQEDAEYRLLGYLAIVKRIFERICRERPGILTEFERRATLRRQGGPPED